LANNSQWWEGGVAATESGQDLSQDDGELRILKTILSWALTSGRCENIVALVGER